MLSITGSASAFGGEERRLDWVSTKSGVGDDGVVRNGSGEVRPGKLGGDICC